jgi:hypothetical protein
MVLDGVYREAKRVGFVQYSKRWSIRGLGWQCIHVVVWRILADM